MRRERPTLWTVCEQISRMQVLQLQSTEEALSASADRASGSDALGLVAISKIARARAISPMGYDYLQKLLWNGRRRVS